MLRKFASAQVLDAYAVPSRAGSRELRKAAHRVNFDYEPRPGYLYVRSRMISSRCNDNHDEFPPAEIKAGWRTFIGKPVFVNHHNDDHKRARGVIIDAAVHEDSNPDGSPDLWVEGLMEIDAKRFPKLAEAILKKRIDRTSMGCDVKFSVCSACGNKATNPAEYCQHIPAMKGRYLYKHTASGKREGTLIREICHGLSFFENSLLVEEPADPTAVFTGVDDRGMKAQANSHVHSTRHAAEWNEDYDDASEENDPEEEQKRFDRESNEMAWKEHNRSRDEGDKIFKHVTDNPTHPWIGWQGDRTELRKREWPERADAGAFGIPLDIRSEMGKQIFDRRKERALTHSKPLEIPHGPVDPRHLSMRKGAPFAGYEDFEDCTEQNADKDDPDAYCGEIKHRTEDKKSASTTAAADFIPWEDRPEGAPPANPQYLPNDRNGNSVGWMTGPGIGEHHPGENGACQSCGTEMGSRERRRYDSGSVPIGLCRNCQHELGVYTSPIQEGFVNRPEHRPELLETKPMIHSVPQSLSSKGSKDQRFADVGLKKDDDGWYVSTHRARSSSYATPEAIPQKDVDYIASTGRRRTAELSDEEIQKGLGMPSAEQGHQDLTHEKAKGLADALMAPFYEPYGGEENYKLHQGNEGMQDLQRRYEGGSGRFGFDEGDDPYYELDHHNQQGKKTGWQIRHYSDGPNAEIRHAATPDESHDMYDIGENTYGSDSGGLGHHIRPPENFGHEHLKKILHDWHDDSETGAREYLEGNEPRIKRYKRINRLSGLETEAVVYKTPQEHPFFQKNVPAPQHIVDTFHEADEPTRKQGMRWYSDAHYVAKSLAGGGDEHAAKGAGVLAAYSPRTSWPLNLFNASRSLQNNKALDKGEGAGIMGQHARSAQRIIDGEHHSQVFKTPKISDFAHLIEHGGDDDSGHTRVVVDRHALSVAVGRRMTDEELEKAPLSSRKYYEHIADQYRAAAAVLSHHYGHEIAPHQVQAVTWLQQQKRNGALDAGDASPGARGRTTMERNQWKRWEDHAKERLPDVDPENLHHKSPHTGMRKRALNEIKAPEQVNTLREEECPVCSESEVYDGERCPVCGFIAPPSMFRDPDLDMAKSVDLRQDQNPNADFGPGQADPNVPGGGLIDPSQLDEAGNPMDTAADQLAHPDQLTPNGIEQGPGTPEDGVADLFCPACGSAFDAGQPVAVGTDTAQPNAAGPEEGAPCPNCGQATLLSQGDMEAMEGQGMDPSQDPLQGQVDPSQTGLPMEDEEGQGEGGGAPVPPGDGQDPDGDQGGEESESDEDAVPPGADTKKDRESNDDEDEDPRRKDPKMSKATEAAVAALTRKVAVLEQQNAFLAQLAGVAPQFQEIRRRADLNNPASPIPDPASAQATESTEQALQSATNDNVQNPGETPGSVNRVPAELTTTPLAPGEVLDTPPASNLIDVTAPTAGTETQLPLSQTRIETDVRVDPDPLKAHGPGVGGAGNDGTAFPWTMSAKDQKEAASANRTMASIRLAKLRLTAGVARGDELQVAAAIETDRNLSDAMIVHEINTLSAVTRATAGRQARPSHLVPRAAAVAPGTVQRTVPSLAPEPVIAATYSMPVGLDDLADALI